MVGAGTGAIVGFTGDGVGGGTGEGVGGGTGAAVGSGAAATSSPTLRIALLFSNKPALWDGIL